VSTAATSVLPPRFDRLDPAVLEDPYPRYAELRAHGPLARGGPGTWLLARYREVAPLLSDPRVGNELPGVYHQVSLGTGPASEFFRRIIFYRDPPVHTRLRRLMAAGFTPRLVNSFAPRIGALVDELLAPGLEERRLDAITELAHPLALRVICLLIGIPPADHASVLPRAADLARGFTLAADEQQRHATDAAVTWLQGYLEELLADRARQPGDDLLSRMLAARHGDGGLSHEEIVDNCVFLFWAGFETVMSVIGTGCAALLRFPDQFERLRAQPELVAGAVEEFLRYDAPIQGTSRIVREELEIGRHRLRPGRILVLLIGSANHDETVFDRPERVDIGRRPNPHVSFGGGHHRCLGNVLARAEAGIVFERLARRVAHLEPAGPVVRRSDTTAMRFHASIPLALTAAPGGCR
jgi:cytochrome P450